MVKTGFQNSFLWGWWGGGERSRITKAGRNQSDPFLGVASSITMELNTLSTPGWKPPEANKLTILCIHPTTTDLQLCGGIVLETKRIDANQTDKTPALAELMVS